MVDHHPGLLWAGTGAICVACLGGVLSVGGVFGGVAGAFSEAPLTHVAHDAVFAPHDVPRSEFNKERSVYRTGVVQSRIRCIAGPDRSSLGSLRLSWPSLGNCDG
jgi:hypothetical protein